MDERSYPGVEADLDVLLDDLREFFEDQSYEFQVRNEPRSTLVQARKASTVRDWTGTSYALTIRITVETNTTRVSAGKQRWWDKAALGATGLVLTPLMPIVLSMGAFGAYRQYKVTEGAWAIIERHMALKSGGRAGGPKTCRGCGAQSSAGKFCAECGMPL